MGSLERYRAKRDPARTPMPWEMGANAGFTAAAEPWLPLADGYETADVARQAELT